jgi:hypothetical protein
LRVFVFETFVKESDMPDNTETIEQQTGFLSIAEMSVDVLLLDKRIRGGGFGKQ